MSPAAREVAVARVAWEANPTRETHIAHMKAKRAYNKTAEAARNHVRNESWESRMSA